MKPQYISKILRNEGDEDYGCEFTFPAGISLDEAVEQLAAEGINYYESRSVWNQIVITIEK